MARAFNCYLAWAMTPVVLGAMLVCPNGYKRDEWPNRGITIQEMVRTFISPI